MIKWNQVTWYSWYGAIFLFIVVLPVLSFYIGRQFEATRQALLESNIVATPYVPKSHMVLSRGEKVVNKKGDLSGVNLGSGIEFTVTSAPTTTSKIEIDHGSSPSGPWITDVTLPYSNNKPLIDIKASTTKTLYYRVEALSESDEVVAVWSPLLIKKINSGSQ